MSAGPTITHAQAAKLREVFKGEQGWAITVTDMSKERSQPIADTVCVRVSVNLPFTSLAISTYAPTVEQGVAQLLGDVAAALPQLPGVPR